MVEVYLPSQLSCVTSCVLCTIDARKPVCADAKQPRQVTELPASDVTAVQLPLQISTQVTNRRCSAVAQDCNARHLRNSVVHQTLTDDATPGRSRADAKVGCMMGATARIA